MSTVNTGPETGLSHRQVLTVLTGLMLAMLLAAMDQTVMATALPTVVGDLGGLNQLSWVVTAYLLTSTSATPLWGKFSDLYGRKAFLQTAILIFLVGSALCGLAQNMPLLIAFRAFQGIGAGGIITLAMAVIADIVPPRERGRYQGYVQAFFAVATVAGPLIGGFFVDHTSWRWVFYINLPLGGIALGVVSLVLRLPVQRRPHKIDFLGSALLLGTVSCLLLVTAWGGDKYAWRSPQIIGLSIVGLILLAGLLVQERRTAEPVLPLSMFRQPVYAIAASATFLVICTLIVVITFLPMFMQVVIGITATNSGLLLVPLMAGLTVASVGAGHIITRTGRYKIFPIIGMAIATTALFLLSGMGTGTSQLSVVLFMVLMGLGIGLVTQVLLLAVQNSVDRREIGTATAGVSFYRGLGGVIGVPVFGAIVTTQLNHWMPRLVPGGGASGVSTRSLLSSPANIRTMTPAVRHGVAEAVAHAVTTAFLVAAPVAAVALLLVLFLKEIPLRTQTHQAPQSKPAAPVGNPATGEAGGRDAG